MTEQIVEIDIFGLEEKKLSPEDQRELENLFLKNDNDGEKESARGIK